MKRIFTFFFALLVCTFFANAQTITENFESYDAFTVDPVGTWTYYDGDGGTTYSYQSTSFTVPNLPYVGSCIVMNPAQVSSNLVSTQGAYSGNQFLAIYNSVPSTITSGTTTNDWVISPQLPFTQGGNITFYARELTDQYNSETTDGGEVMRILYSTTDNSPSSFTQIQRTVVSTTTWTQYSYSIPAGAKYVAINCQSNNVFALFIDDITITCNNTDPTIISTPSTVDFGEINLPGTANRTVSVAGYNLTNNITATVSGPFEVSADGTNFSSSITIISTGGTLYLRYAPSAQGSHTGNLTLTSGTATTTVPLMGLSVDCSIAHNMTYTCEFNTGSAELNCWQIVDANNDGFTYYFVGDMAIYSYNTDATTAANDWLISPEIALGNNARVSFNYKVGTETSGGSAIPETFGVYVIPQGGSYTTASAVLAPTTVSETTWTTQNIDLSAYNYQTVRIAIHISSPADMWRLFLDHFVVDSDVPPTLVSNVDMIDFGRVRIGDYHDEIAVLTSTHMNEPLNIVTDAPFTLSIDGINFFNPLTIPANPAINVDDTLYIRFTPETAGSYFGTTTATPQYSPLSVSFAMKGTGFVCDTITNFTFTESFDNVSSTRECWDINDANNDESTFDFVGDVAQYAGNATHVADDWLLSPEVALTGNQLLTFEYRTPSTQAPGKFTVAAVSSDTTLTLTEIIEATSDIYTSQSIDLRSLDGIWRLAIHCVSDSGAASLEIENFTIREMDAPFLEANPNTMTFATRLEEAPVAQTATVTGWALTENITISTTAPFEISTDGNSYSTDATITVEGLETNATLHVRYSPTTEGTHSGTVILTSGVYTDTIVLNGTVVVDNPTLEATPNTMTFTGTVGEATAAQTTTITGSNLTEDVNVRVAEPFEISTDGSSFGSEATLTVTGTDLNTTLYVRYNPVTEGSHSGTAILNSGNANCTITLNGTAETVGIMEMCCNTVSIYPNPATTILNVVAEGYDNLQIVNIFGQIVHEATVSERMQIDVSELSNGVYFVRLNGTNGTTTQKFIKK
ncbi:MAG: T9SS type A sorting domain-containing protein [Bacteroidales bacterium]|nr:T9SS type A sorting domain-containing protein [Bacteroidales bacterium]